MEVSPARMGEQSQVGTGLALVAFGERAGRAMECFAESLNGAGAPDLIRSARYVPVRKDRPDSPSFKRLFDATGLNDVGITTGKVLSSSLEAEAYTFLRDGLPPIERVLHFISYEAGSLETVLETNQLLKKGQPNLAQLGLVAPFSAQDWVRKSFEMELDRYPVNTLGLPVIVMDDTSERISGSPPFPSHKNFLKGVVGLFAGPISLPHLNEPNSPSLIDQLISASNRIGVGLYERRAPLRESSFFGIGNQNYLIDEHQIVINNLVRHALKPSVRFTRGERIAGSTIDVAVVSLPFHAKDRFWHRRDLDYGHTARGTYNLYNDPQVPNQVELVLSPTEPVYTKRLREVAKTFLFATHFYPVKA